MRDKELTKEVVRQIEEAAAKTLIETFKKGRDDSRPERMNQDQGGRTEIGRRLLSTTIPAAQRLT